MTSRKHKHKQKRNRPSAALLSPHVPSHTPRSPSPTTAISAEPLMQKKSIGHLIPLIALIIGAIALVVSVVIWRYPISPSGNLNLGKIQLNNRQYDKAIKSLTEAVKDQPDNPDVYYCRGMAHIQVTEPDEAINDFTTAIMLKNDPDTYIKRGGTYVTTEQYDEAIADLTKALTLTNHLFSYKSRWIMYFFRGAAYMKNGRFHEASNDFSSVIEIKPDWALAYSCRGVTSMYDNTVLIGAKRHFTEIRKDFSTTITLAPKYGFGYLCRAFVNVLLQDFDTAFADFTAYKALGNPDARMIPMIDEGLRLCSPSTTRPTQSLPIEIRPISAYPLAFTRVVDILLIPLCIFIPLSILIDMLLLHKHNKKHHPARRVRKLIVWLFIAVIIDSLLACGCFIGMVTYMIP
jgi:tetratricopeptide (TPR) repeat protein